MWLKGCCKLEILVHCLNFPNQFLLDICRPLPNFDDVIFVICSFSWGHSSLLDTLAVSAGLSQQFLLDALGIQLDVVLLTYLLSIPVFLSVYLPDVCYLFFYFWFTHSKPKVWSFSKSCKTQVYLKGHAYSMYFWRKKNFFKIKGLPSFSYLLFFLVMNGCWHLLRTSCVLPKKVMWLFSFIWS